MQDAAIAYYFWRESQKSAFPAPLFVIHIASIAHYLVSTLTQISHWWMAAIANRLFEIALAYVAGCSIYRMRELYKKEKKGALAERPDSTWRAGS